MPLHTRTVSSSFSASQEKTSSRSYTYSSSKTTSRTGTTSRSVSKTASVSASVSDSPSDDPSSSSSHSQNATRSASLSALFGSTSHSATYTSTLTPTQRLLATHTLSHQLQHAPPPENYFAFQQTETILFTVNAIIALGAIVISMCSCKKGAAHRRAKQKAREARLREETTVRDGAMTKREQDAYEKATNQEEDVEVAYGDFEHAILHHDDPVSLLFSPQARTSAEVQRVSAAIDRIHPVLGGSNAAAATSVYKRVLGADHRLEKLQREKVLHEEVFLPSLADDGRLSAREVATASGVELMFTSKQVAPVELEELPWLSPEEIDSIQNHDAFERKMLLVQGGRNPKQILYERETLSALGNGDSPEARPGMAETASVSALHRSKSSRSSAGGDDHVKMILRSQQPASVASDEGRRSMSETRSDATKVSAIGKRSSAYYLRMQEVVESDVRSASSAGNGSAKSTLPTWAKQAGGLFEAAPSPLVRIRNVTSRVSRGPIRPMDDQTAFSENDGVQGERAVDSSVSMLPDPDMESFAGLDIDVRLLDADL